MKAHATTPASLLEAHHDPELIRDHGISKKIQWFFYRLALIITDISMVSIGFLLAYLVRFSLAIPVFQLDVVPSLSYYTTITGLMVPAWLVIFALSELYHQGTLLGGTREYSLVFRAVTTGVLVVIIAGFLGPEFVIARGWLIFSWIFVSLFVIAGRFVLRRVVYWLRRYGYFTDKAVIVGSNAEARLMVEQLSDGNLSGLRIVGFVGNDKSGFDNHVKSIPYLGSIDQLDTIIQMYQPEEIIVATSSQPRDLILQLFKKYGLSPKINMRLSSGLYELITTGIQVSEFASVPLVKVNKVRLTGNDEIFKNVLDYGLTIPGLILISPLLLLIALLIRLDSPGPIIHRRRVMGVNGKQFDAFKFRTMHTNGDAILKQYPELEVELAANHKIKDDPRITRIGKFLRKFSLDELPQCVNVLRHEMSLVGPRMISPEEMPKYNQWGINLLTVRPGITGLWQVSGRSDISYDERVRLDMYYIRNWTVWMDLALLARTIPAALSSRGAY